MDKNKFPEIEFKIDREAEKEVALFFLEWGSFDKFTKDYPNLKKAKEMDKDKAKEFLNLEIDKIYKIKKSELINKKEEIENNWDKIKIKFFKEAEKTFNHKWPIAKYTANISVFGMYRFKPGTKTFSIPSEDYAGNPPSFGHINYTIMHEMLHILFEDFYNAHFKNSLPIEKYYDLMEIVNCVILNLKQFTNISHWKTYPYPQHKEVYENLKDKYNGNLKEFVEEAIKHLE